MYQTVLRSVNGYTAVGANGERLQFVGNWYGSAGDTVWTDGNIIFGHSPLRASSTMMMLPSNSGIPVLCDNLRGYFSPTGAWNDYDIAQKDWIVNNENYFFSSLDSTVKDAIVSDKGDLYLVSGGQYSEYQHISKNDRLNLRVFYINGQIFWVSLWDYIFLLSINEHNVEYTIDSYSFGMLGENLQEPLIIYKNATIFDTIDLTPFANDLKQKFFAFRDKLIENDLTVDDDIITALNIWIMAINMDKNGSVTYRVFGAIHGYFNVTYFTNEIVSQVEPCFSFTDFQMWLPYGISCIYNADQSIENIHSYGGLRTTAQIPSKAIQIMEEVNINFYATNTVDYPFTVWKTRNGDLFRKMDGAEINEEFSINTIVQSTTENIVLNFQVGDGFCKLSKYGLASFYDSDNKLIAENIVVDDDYLYVEIDSYDTDKLDIFTGFTVSGLELNVKYKIYTPDGKITEKEADLSTLDTDVDADGIPLMDGYYTRGTNDELTPFYFKPILKKLSDTVYLFGTHGGKLYIKTKSGIQEIGDGLKNFRLEILNDISKAKG